MNEESKSENYCEVCGKNKANIYVTDFVDGEPVKKYICQDCYESEEGAPPLSSSELFSKLVGIIAPELRKAGRKKCPECGMDYIEFRQALKFGCPNDYRLFHEALDDLFKDMHGANRHFGKIPEGEAQNKGDRTQRLEVLNREMERAVKREDYERAGDLKNKIEQLEEASVGDIEN